MSVPTIAMNQSDSSSELSMETTELGETISCNEIKKTNNISLKDRIKNSLYPCFYYQKCHKQKTYNEHKEDDKWPKYNTDRKSVV